MSDETAELSGPPAWYQEIFPGGKRTGFYENYANHALVFVDRGSDTLVVSFDNLAEAGGRHLAREPWAGKFVADNGWSHLGIFAHGPTWFRDKDLIDRLEALRDAGMFEKHTRVIFCGSSMGGFGALTFARLSPGSTVVAFSPQSTVDPKLVPWEQRFKKARGQDWDLPYSDAAGGMRDVGRAYVVYDRFVVADRQHVERLESAALVALNAPGCGHKSAFTLRRMDRLKPVMSAAIEGELSHHKFAQLMRNRKDIYLYKRTMQAHLSERNRPEMADRFGQAFKARRHKRA